jgi:hypothetical protein
MKEISPRRRAMTLVCLLSATGCEITIEHVTIAGQYDLDASAFADHGNASSASAIAVVNGCTSFVDRSEASAIRVLPWDSSIESNPLRCVQIKMGQNICWDGDLSVHPLVPLGGDIPTPIGPACATFNQTGSYGYHCAVHPNMQGAVQVVP